MTRNRTTGIEWTEHTWNPFVGCSIHTAGCTNCYAMPQAARIIRMGHTSTYDGTIKHAKNGAPIWTGKINRASAQTMRKPFSISQPSIIFVNSMSDFFHENALDEWRMEALGIMAATPHQYQVLTKRPENIQPFLDRCDVPILPPNVWIGATVERGDFVNRIDVLRTVPATIRFLSIEPLIGHPGTMNLSGIHWVIVGGESGPGARPMDAEWVRAVRDQCRDQRVPMFLKQWGIDDNNPIYIELRGRGHTLGEAAEQLRAVDPVGKGGSKIDGREWKDYPAFDLRGSLI